MNNQISLIKYAIDYLSKFNSSKKNLEKIIRNKIMRLNIEKKDKIILYNSIPKIILKLESNKLIDDNLYAISKVRALIQYGKSKLFIKNYLLQKGVEKLIIANSFEEYESQNPNWEIESAKTFIRKKNLNKSSENYHKNLSKMARAGFSYDLCKNLLNKGN